MEGSGCSRISGSKNLRRAVVLNLLVLAESVGFFFFFGLQHSRIWKKLKYDIKIDKVMYNII